MKTQGRAPRNAPNPGYSRVIAEATPEAVTLAAEYKQMRAYIYANSCVADLRIAASRNRHLYEIIHADKPRKAYFDIDLDVPQDTPADECEARFSTLQVDVVAKVKEVLGDTRVFLSGCIGEKQDCIRLSLHAIAADIVYKDHKHMVECNLKAAATKIGQELGINCDTSIYTRNRLFKLPG